MASKSKISLMLVALSLLLLIPQVSAQQNGVQQCTLRVTFKGNGIVEVYNHSFSDSASSNSSFTLDCGTSVYIYAKTPNFVRWECAGSGCYSGIEPIDPITLSSNIVETGIFVGSQTTSTTTALVVNRTANKCGLSGVVRGYGEIKFYNSTSPANYTYKNMTINYICGDTVYINAISKNFEAWLCSGRGCYEGINSSMKLILNHSITEIAVYEANATTAPNVSSTSTASTTTALTATIGSGNSKTPGAGKSNSSSLIWILAGIAVTAIAAYVVVTVIRKRA